jgi:hypothetical protein
LAVPAVNEPNDWVTVRGPGATAPAPPTNAQASSSQTDPGDWVTVSGGPSTTSTSNNSGGILGSAEGFAQGVGKEITGTVSSLDDAMSKIPGIGSWLTSPIMSDHSAAASQATRSAEHDYANSADPNHPTAEALGRGTAGLGEILLTDGALRGLSLSQRLLQAGKLADAVESSPTLQRIVSAGIRAIRSGAASAAVTGASTEDPNAAIGAGVTGGILGGVGPEVPGAIKAAGRTVSNAVGAVVDRFPATYQDALQSGIRNTLNDVADSMGVTRSNAPSIRDVAHDVANAAEARAKAAYQQLDDVTGGRAQRFRDAIKNVQQKVNELNGIDPDLEGHYVERLNDLMDAHENAMQEAQAAGIPRNQLAQADQDFRRNISLKELGSKIRQATTGLRPEMAQGAARPIPERVDPNKLLNGLNKLYDSPKQRLTNALGTNGAKKILQLANDAASIARTNQAWKRLATHVAPGAAGAIGLGEIVHHLFGE